AYKGMSYNGVIARFTDGNPLALAADFSATINFTDSDAGIGPQPGVMVALGNGAFEITTPFSFPAARSYNLRVDLTHEGNTQQATGSITVNVSDYIRMLPGVAIIDALKGAGYYALLARFTTNNSNAVPADFRVTVQWGDGTNPDNVTPDSGLSVAGSATY